MNMDASRSTAKNPRVLIQLHVLLLVVLMWYSVAAYSTLPDRYPVHFNFKGEIDRWAEKGSVEYWMLPVAGVVLGILLLASLCFPPRWYNFPQKAQVDRWPQEHRMPVYDTLKEMLMIVALVIDVMLLAIQVSVVQSAEGHPSKWIAAVFGAALCLPVVAVVYLVRISRLVKRIERELKAAG